MRKLNSIILLILVVFLESCSTSETVVESTLINDMKNANFVIVDNISSDKLIFHQEVASTNYLTESEEIIFENLYTFSDEQSDDYGYIYEIEDDISLQWYFEHLCDYSYYISDLLFVYKLDNYVLEVYHSPDSTFPGFLRHYDILANDLYNYYFSYDISNPFVNYLLNQGYEDVTTDLNDLDKNHSAFTRMNIELRNIRELKNGNSTIIVISCNSLYDAQKVFEEQSILMPVGGNKYYAAIIHQTNVYRIITYESNFDNLLTTYFSDVKYKYYVQYDDLYQQYFDIYFDLYYGK